MKEEKRSRNAGYSLPEVLIVVMLISIGSSIALIQMKSSLTTLDADQASNLVVSEINYARQIAVDQRLNVLLEFDGTNEIKVTRQNSDTTTTVMADVFLPSPITFQLASGVGDTPDGYGNASAVYFNNATSGTFLGDGTFISAGTILLNGSVFTLGSGNGSARAVTLSGSTGRVKQYYLQGTTWVVR